MSQRSTGLCTRCTRANAFPAQQQQHKYYLVANFYENNCRVRREIFQKFKLPFNLLPFTYFTAYFAVLLEKLPSNYAWYP